MQNRAERALGLGLCDSRSVLSPEQLQGLDHDLQALQLTTRGLKNTVISPRVGRDG